MKKLSTLCLMLVSLLAVTAQQSVTKHVIDKENIKQENLKKLSGFPIHQKQVQQSSRAATYSVMLDNPGVDAAYADLITADFFYDPTLSINQYWRNTDNLTHRWAVALYDSLLYIDNTQPAFFPRAKTTLTLDSLDVLFIHKRAAGSTSLDTIKFTVFDRSTLTVTGAGAAAQLTHNSIWDTLIITNTELPLNISNGGTPTFTGLTFYPNISLPLGAVFGVRTEFFADTANDFNLIASFRDDCSNTCVAEESAANSATYTNSLYYINATTGTGQNISGINSIGFNCGPPCNQWTAQNWWVYPWITADVEYSAAIVADSLFGCPGRTLNLTAYGFGSTATPFTYAWSTNSGTLSSPSDQFTGLNIVGNATVTVTVTDANQQTVTASINVASRGINLSFTSPSPLQLSCGGSASITTAVTGTTTSRTYTWNTGATGGNSFSTIPVNIAGNYSVTVTNGSGCSASAATSVVYSNGATNTVSFTPPSPPVCRGQSYTFTNTSANTAGWDAKWDMGNTDIVLGTNASYTYNTLGFYTVTLEMDSAGCKFLSQPRTVQVTQCPVGIDDISFEKSINILPNPSNGNITVTVNDVEKFLNIRVYNIIGSLIRTFNTNEVSTSTNRTLDLSDLANGTYLVKIETAGKTAVKRITISK